MKGSFHRIRYLGMGALLGLILVIAGIAAFYIRDVGKTLRFELSFHERKTQHFHEIARRFSQLGATFYQQRAKDRLNVAVLKADLDAIRQQLAELDVLPLTAVEMDGVATLALQESRFRTAMYAFAAAVREDPAPGFSGTVLPEIEAVLTSATQQAEHHSKAATDAMQQTRAHLEQAVEWTLGILVVGTLVVLGMGVLVSILLARAFGRTVTERIWQAIYRFGAQRMPLTPRMPSTGERAPDGSGAADSRPASYGESGTSRHTGRFQPR